MEDRYGLSRQHSGIWKSLRDGDFEEEDVWDVLKDNNNRADYYGPVGGALKIKGKESLPLPAPRPLLPPTASRMIPRPNSTTNITSSCSSHHESKVFQQSAPVNIPDWSKIYNRKNSNNIQNKPHKKNNNINNSVSRFDGYNLYHSVEYGDDDDDAGYGGENNHVNNNNNSYDGGDSDDDDDDLEDGDDEYDPNKLLPPHEFIARRLARSQISSFSVLEGVGRTLKGRDLSKVRNAVLTKTGFLESL